MDRELEDELNRPLTGYVRIVTDLRELIEHEDAQEHGEADDAWDETTDTARPYELTIGFEAMTELEVELIVAAVTAFTKRRTTAVDTVFTLRKNR